MKELHSKPDHFASPEEPHQGTCHLRGHFCRDPFVGGSLQMQEVSRLVARVSQSRCPVLILGETGTGKERVAHCIHDWGPRASHPFVPVDCAALAPTLIESELFGHAKGAFTGAMSARMGLLESANKGTIFLDEVGELPGILQAKLLRVLQEREVRPVGGTQRIPIDVRVLAATHRDLEAAIRDRSFRHDLYFRLNVVRIVLPPLRERKSDIPALVDYFLSKFSGPSLPVHAISQNALHRLLAYDWPGNVRELENAIESAIAICSGTTLQVDDLPRAVHDVSAKPFSAGDGFAPLEDIEKRAIFQALRETDGDKSAAARLLGVGKTTLYRKLNAYRLESSQSAASATSKEPLHEEQFLLCIDPKCRYIVDLRAETTEITGPPDLQRKCPKCGHLLSGRCPSCFQQLDIVWRDNLPLCSCCNQTLQPEV